jgi:DNA-binding NarL/FixJ family response regulator
VLQAENGKDLLEKLNEGTVDIVLMDIRMPEMDGLEASIQVKEHFPQIKIIILSQYDLEENIVNLYKQGVKSFIGKDDNPTELIKAIRTVFNGGFYMTDRVGKVIQRYLGAAPLVAGMTILTNEEKFLLTALCKGHSSTEIGNMIFKSPRTVEKHREDLYRKFGVSSKEQLILLTSKQGLI